MSSDRQTETELLKTILKPLLEDFEYWFANSRSLLETERLPFFSEPEQSELLNRVRQIQQEVKVAQMLFDATNEEVGIDFQTLLPWHQLVAECWDMARRWRELNHDRQDQL
jgi:hypothetical protein